MHTVYRQVLELAANPLQHLQFVCKTLHLFEKWSFGLCLNIVSCSLARFTVDNGMSNILKRQVIKNAFNYSGCMFFGEVSKEIPSIML